MGVKALSCKVNVSEQLNWSFDNTILYNFSLYRPQARALESKWDRILLGITVRVRVMG